MKKHLLMMLIASSSLHAETFNVSTTPELRTALTEAASNNQDDIIILTDGVYKTTDDGQGSFTYFSNEVNAITIKGAPNADVTLSGDRQHQILNNNKLEDGFSSVLTIENITFTDGNSITSGGAIFSNQDNLILRNTHFKNNTAIGNYGGAIIVYPGDLEIYGSTFIGNNSKAGGGAIRIHGSGVIRNSTFSQNYTREYTGTWSHGGAILNSGASELYIFNSSFTQNTSNGGGGGAIWGKVEAEKITVFRNIANGSGGGLRVSGNIINSIIDSNSCNGACYGGGVFLEGNEGGIYNSIISNNIGDVDNNYPERNSGALYAAGSIVANNLIINNSSGAGSSSSTFINNIFINNNSFDINSMNNTVAELNNNYIDEAKILGVNIQSNNIFEGINLGFVDEQNGDYNLNPSSDLIDVGVSDENIILPELDLNGNSRKSGAAIDIGPYEFSDSRPTVNSLSFTGDAKESSELIFSIDYTLAEHRTLQSIEFDYLNEGVYTSNNFYTFTSKGNYEVKVKVTDNQGEFSIGSLSITIAELPFEEMTYEQKLAKAILPEYYDAILAEIEIEKTSSFWEGKQYVQDNLTEFNLVTVADKDAAVTAATSNGIATGKQYVQDNLAEFNLVTVADKDAEVTAATSSGIATGKQYVQDNLAEFNLVTVADKVAAVTAATSSGIETGRQLVISDPSSFGINIVVPLSKENIELLPEGWEMISVPSKVEDMSIFDGSKTVWSFNNDSQTWSAYSPNAAVIDELQNQGIPIIMTIEAGSGIWIEK